MKIRNISGRLNNDDLIQLASLLIKAGYVASLGSSKPEGKQRRLHVNYDEPKEDLNV